MSVERARQQLQLAEGRWERAIAEHAQPPPEPTAFARRQRTLADAAAQEQAAYQYAADEGFGWRPGRAWLAPRELRPALWRESLAPAEAWERLDEAIERLSSARTGVSVHAIAQAFGGLAEAAVGARRGRRRRSAQARRRRRLKLAHPAWIASFQTSVRTSAPVRAPTCSV